jgi:hypothetical protein
MTGIKDRLEAACREAGLDGALGRKLVDRVLDATGSDPAAGDESAAGGCRGDEADLERIRAEIARMAAVEEEMKSLLGVASRDAIVPALEDILEKVKVLRIAAGFDGPSTPA